ncbi:MAG TPA: GNAT family N-acetyltransferase [Caldilineaceae bacterium]|nr:GNAT family N-acetyltransferase [Caldilineaceae bacterium]
MSRTETIHLRAATLEELAEIVALDRAIFGAYGAAEEERVISARLTVFPEGCVVLVDHSDEGPARVIGYLTTEKWSTVREPALDEDPWITHQPDGQVLNITTLAVAAGYQNQGLGQRLLHSAFEIAQRGGCTQIVLETAHAAQFYRRNGFAKSGERRQRGIVLHIMQRVID